MEKSILERLGVTLEELDAVLTENPSLRGTIIGYLGEIKLKTLLAQNKQIEVLSKPDDHDRKKKYDLPIRYKGHIFRIEVKSLQTNTIKAAKEGSGITHEAKVQCDASDCRQIVLPNKQTVTTTCLQYGGFDILAVNLYMFNHKWEYAFALNERLPQSGKGNKKHPIPEDCRQYLIKTQFPITYPLSGIFTSDICSLLDELIAKKRG